MTVTTNGHVNGPVDTPGTIPSPERSDGVRSGGDEVGAGPLPPPPPAPPIWRQTLLGARSWWSKHSGRSKALVLGIVVIGSTIVIVRMFIHPVDAERITDDAAAAAYGQAAADIAAARAEATQLVMPAPFSWARCPVTEDAQTLIGGDPATNFKTMNPQRATPVEKQVQDYLIGFTLPEMRLSVVDGGLVVSADDPTRGVALFNCLAGNVPATTVPTS